MKYCVRYRKQGAVRFISHRDTERMWRRTLRRAGIPLLLSRGFSPKEKIEMCYPLPVGVESVCEDIVISLSAPMAAAEIRTRLAACLPEGFSVVDVSARESADSLFHRTAGLTYEAAGRSFLLPVRNGACEKLWAFLGRELGISEQEARLLEVSRRKIHYRS